MRTSIHAFCWLLSLVWVAPSWAVDEPPAAFKPFEHLIGSWKGTASPAANRVKGWAETHQWAWKFEKSKPVAMTIDWQGDRTLSKGTLTYNQPEKNYRLDGTDPAGKPIAFVGPISPDGKTLTLEKVGAGKKQAVERIIVRPAANMIRYTVQVETQDPGAPQFKKQIEVGLTKAGVAFAAGGASENLPKCIMTGGAATMTVSYQGKTYSVCCTGCRDEFNENPEKYAKKAEADVKAQPATAKAASGTGSRSTDDGSFDGLFEESRPKSRPK